jgi:hypothetical protein
LSVVEFLSFHSDVLTKIFVSVHAGRELSESSGGWRSNIVRREDLMGVRHVWGLFMMSVMGKFDSLARCKKCSNN